MVIELIKQYGMMLPGTVAEFLPDLARVLIRDGIAKEVKTGTTVRDKVIHPPKG